MKLFKFVMLFFLLSQCYAFGTGRSKDTKVSASVSLYGALGTYANPPRLDNGRVDARRLLSELKEIHADIYHWLIFKSATDWDDLKEFLPMAREAKIKVWVSLVPPTESKPISKWSSEPYGLDYQKWAVEIANLSVKEPNLVVWSIDDFVHNLKFYTPEYTKKMLDAAHAVNPKLAFIPCCYYKQITPTFVANYKDLLDGILFPYRAESAGGNLKDATLVENEISSVRKLFDKPGFPVYIDIYATAHSRLGPSTPEYVKDVILSGRKYADGVMIYCHQDPVKAADKYQVIKKGFKGRVK